ncbi:hypothetical protein MMC20_006267 [Loxospora ochrophaea]|nr:hypothetical protein [Loxospora ochrophaea]
MVAISNDYNLTIRQPPRRARVVGPKEKDRKPVDPPPIIQLHIRDASDPTQNYLQSPYFFMLCTLWDATYDQPPQTSLQSALAGTLVSSLHRLKDVDNTDGGFFVFGDLSVKLEGDFRLRFNLFEMVKTEVVYIKSITTDRFRVFSAKNFPGMDESTFLSRSFGDQGVRLRIRKEPRSLPKRPIASRTRPEDFSHPYPPAMALDPRSHTGQPVYPQGGSYGHPPSSEYPLPYGESSTKRQRTSVDMTVRGANERDTKYSERFVGEYKTPDGHFSQNPQYLTYGSNFPQILPPTLSATSEFTFRPSPLSPSSPYEVPGPQFQILSQSTPSYQHQGHVGYNYQQGQMAHSESLEASRSTRSIPPSRHYSHSEHSRMSSLISPSRRPSIDDRSLVRSNNPPVSSTLQTNSYQGSRESREVPLTERTAPRSSSYTVLPPLQSTTPANPSLVGPPHQYPSSVSSEFDPRNTFQTSDQVSSERQRERKEILEEAATPPSTTNTARRHYGDPG